jgi:two-component system LytT family response regulator
MIKTLIIDDEPLAREIVKEYLMPYAEISVVEECNDGFHGLKAIQQHQPDLIFLDIQMPKINGFEMLELVEQSPAVIFTTAYDEFAVKAFEAHAVDYLLKPFSKDRFDKAVQKFLKHENTSSKKATESLLEKAAQLPQQSQRIVVKDGSKIKIIPIHDVQYLEAADDYVSIVTADGTFLKNKTMSFFENTLNASQFIRVHRSYILNVQQMVRIEPYEKENHIALLKSGKKVPVSKAGYAKLKSVLGL